MANGPEAPEEAPPKKGNGGLLLVVVLVNTLALVGGGVYLAFFFKPAMAAPAAEPEAEEHPKEIGPLLEIEPIVANLAEPGAARFLKVTFHVELEDEEAMHEMDSKLVPIRSAALFYLSSLTTEDTVGTEKKEAVREALLEKIQEALGSKAVRGLYFTEFVVQ